MAMLTRHLDYTDLPLERIDLTRPRREPNESVLRSAEDHALGSAVRRLQCGARNAMKVMDVLAGCGAESSGGGARANVEVTGLTADSRAVKASAVLK